MTTPSTVAVGRPDVGAVPESQSQESRFRRVFRRRARERRAPSAPHSGWRDEATLRASTRV